jgi:hypothetical protein
MTLTPKNKPEKRTQKRTKNRPKTLEKNNPQSNHAPRPFFIYFKTDVFVETPIVSSFTVGLIINHFASVINHFASVIFLIIVFIASVIINPASTPAYPQPTLLDPNNALPTSRNLPNPLQNNPQLGTPVISSFVAGGHPH